MTRPFTSGQMGPAAVALLNDLWEMAEAAGLTPLADQIHAATAKSPPVDGDEFAMADSAASFALKKVLFSAIKTTLASATQTLTNKRVTARITSEASSATPTINTDNCDIHQVTALTVAVTSFTTNLTGTPVEGDVLFIEVTGTASRALTWGSKFEASTVALPTTTSGTAKLTVGFLYNDVTDKWRCVAVC